MTHSAPLVSGEILDVAVIVPTYRRPERVKRLIEALVKQTVRPDRWELVLVDDGSDQATGDQVEALAKSSPLRVRVLRCDTNRGPAFARNLGWRSTRAPLIAFTDDDCEPAQDWLEAGCAALRASTRIGVVQGRTTRPPGSQSYPYSCFTVIREVLQASPWFEGCNLFFRREALEEGGGFDESIAFFGEETSLGWAVLGRGWDRGWAEDAVVIHELAERPWRWHLKIHYLERNIVLLAAKYPEIRSTFWRPWAVKRENALFALALAGLFLTARWRSALMLLVPYLYWLFPPGRPPIGSQAAFHQISVHAASLLGKLSMDVRHGILIL